MKLRIIQNSFFLFVGVFWMSCASTKSSNKLTKGNEFDFNPALQFNHISNDSTQLLLRFNSEELLYMRNESSPSFKANLNVKVIQEFTDKSDTIEFNLFPPKRDDSGYWEKTLVFNHPIGVCKYWVEISDLNRNLKSIHVANVPKLNTPNLYDIHFQSKSENKLITTVESDSHFLRKDDTLTMILPRFPNDSVLNIEVFELKELPPLPPPAFSNNNPVVADSTFLVKLNLSHSNGVFTLAVPNHGLMFRSEKDYLYFISVHGDFPEPTNFKDLIGPMRFIMSKSEFEQLSTSPDPYTYFCNFWRDCGGTDEKAKQLISIYFQRIATSNLNFSTLVPGWRTDRGMIYTVFGKPTRVEANSYTERWQYGDENLPGSFAFVFRKRDHSFSSKVYVLNRDALYRNVWESAVNSWRSGRVYKE